MTPYKNLTLLYFLIIGAMLYACATTKNGLTKKRIVMNESYKHLYVMQIPKGDVGVSKIFRGHGQGFLIQYPDNALIYYTDDISAATVNYPDNYKSINYVTPAGGLQSDTTIGGQQKDGTYWKEIFHPNYYIGYKNVSKNQILLFDKSLETFEQKK